MVSAWARQAGVVLGQVKVDDKSNEITAIPKLLDLLEARGCIVTIDAMGCQKEIAQKIRQKGADYILSVKGNQPSTLAAVEEIFASGDKKGWKRSGPKHSVHQAINGGHGRIETRIYDTTPAPDHPALDEWPGLETIVRVQRERQQGDKTTTETHYYISSRKTGAKDHSKFIRGHWSIENQLHWSLDVQFSEDKNRIRIDNAPENAAIIRRMALNLVKLETTAKASMRGKRKMAGWNNDYLLTVLKCTPLLEF